jgi:hypothetical protein
MNDNMQYNSTISLVVKVIDSEIFKGMGEIGEDGRATGCEISVDCLGTDEGCKIFNVNIRTTAATYEEAGKIIEKLSCNSIHYIQGIFFLDSNEKLDFITVFDPRYEPLSNEAMAFYSKIFNMHGHKKVNQ